MQQVSLELLKSGKLRLGQHKTKHMVPGYEIYFPRIGERWGKVPKEAIMPWEVRRHSKDEDK
jgi:hypothetical protein